MAPIETRTLPPDTMVSPDIGPQPPCSRPLDHEPGLEHECVRDHGVVIGAANCWLISQRLSVRIGVYGGGVRLAQ
jgi:hypothetical protein